MINLSLESDRKQLSNQIKSDIDKFCADKYNEDHRAHLGASVTGEACSRKLWYGFRWVKLEKHEGRIQRLFQVGHEAEPRFKMYLEGIGFKVKLFQNPILHYHPESNSYHLADTFNPGDGLVEDVTGIPQHEIEALKRGFERKQFRISAHNGHYGGSLDGIAFHQEYGQFLLEFKTNSTGKGFASVETDGLKKAKPKHFGQMSQYGWHYKLKYGLYLIENKNDSDITIQIVELDWKLGQELQNKAGDIINAGIPPPKISLNESYFDCKYCTFVDICHNGECVETNCRSCRYSKPVEDARWYCEKHSGLIPENFVKTGCQDHVSCNGE